MNPRSRFFGGKLVPSAALMLLALVSFYPALAADSASKPSSSAATGIDRLDEPWWALKHQSILQNALSNANAQVLFVGGSVLANFGKCDPPEADSRAVWKQFYEPRHAVNLAFSGDTTSNVLWRIQHGELDGLHPKVVVVLVGGPDAFQENQSAAQTVNGIDAVLGEISWRLPQTRILLLGLLPNGGSAAQTAHDEDVNSRLETLFAGNRHVLYLDLGAIFYGHAGLDPALFCKQRLQGTPLYPNSMGQRRLAEAIEPALSNLVGDTSRLNAAPAAEIAQQQ